MTETILSKLNEIEHNEQVKILYAVEAGSRAKGIASPDSDYDVRFCYIRPRNEYLRLKPRRDVIIYPISDGLDINGWDLGKALRLLHLSNPTFSEWLSSGIVYMTTDYFQSAIPAMKTRFSTKNLVFHYCSIAYNTWHKYQKKERIKGKPYLIAIRAILACLWIICHNDLPPLELSILLDDQKDTEIKPYVEDFLRIKLESPKDYEFERIPVIDAFIENNLALIRKLSWKKRSQSNKSWDLLDNLFIKAVNQFDSVIEVT